MRFYQAICMDLALFLNLGREAPSVDQKTSGFFGGTVGGGGGMGWLNCFLVTVFVAAFRPIGHIIILS